MAAAPRHASDKPPVSFYSIASEMFDIANGDSQLALRRMIIKIEKDTALRHQLLTNEIIEGLCRNAIHSVAGTRRHAVWTVPKQQDGRARVIALANATVPILLDMQFEGIPRLGDANREIVTVTADRYEKTAADRSHKARWLRLIAQHMPDGKSVKDVMTNERLAELRSEAERG
jgi:hypothetical protein